MKLFFVRKQINFDGNIIDIIVHKLGGAFILIMKISFHKIFNIPKNIRLT